MQYESSLKEQVHLQDLTVFIFTRNRPQFLCGLLDYWKLTDAQVMVLDASSSDTSARICKYYGVGYEWAVSFNERVQLLLKREYTEFALINMDDDLVSHVGATRAIEVLRSDDSVIGVASARNFCDQYFDRESLFRKRKFLYSDKSVIARLNSWSVKGLSPEYPWYAVWRKDSLLRNFTITFPVIETGGSEDDLSLNFCLSAVAQGKFIKAEFDIYLKRRHSKLQESNIDLLLTEFQAPQTEGTSDESWSNWSETSARVLSGTSSEDTSSLRDAFIRAHLRHKKWSNIRRVKFIIRFKKSYRMVVEKIYQILQQARSQVM